jgi:uncharacterized protein (DUF427 family)
MAPRTLSAAGASLAGRREEAAFVQATLRKTVLADSEDVVECDGYAYFPRAAVRMELLEKSARTPADRACPHGVQFYDALVDGERFERVAWSYEAPKASMQHVGMRLGFWDEVEVA